MPCGGGSPNPVVTADATDSHDFERNLCPMLCPTADSAPLKSEVFGKCSLLN